MLRVMSYTAALAAVEKKFSAMLVAEKEMLTRRRE